MCSKCSPPMSTLGMSVLLLLVTLLREQSYLSVVFIFGFPQWCWAHLNVFTCYSFKVSVGLVYKSISYFNNIKIRSFRMLRFAFYIQYIICLEYIFVYGERSVPNFTYFRRYSYSSQCHLLNSPPLVYWFGNAFFVLITIF